MAQSYLTGYVFDEVNKEPLAGAAVKVVGEVTGTTTAEDGSFQVDLQPGLYNIEVSFTGYTHQLIHEVKILGIKPTYLEVLLKRKLEELETVVITSDAFKKTPESPMSMKNLNVDEIRRMPGANLDISKSILSYPGVLPKPSFGYSISVRGGASSENQYYLDGIYIPTITHFTVQGASGGPAGMINSDFLRGSDLYTGAFPSSRGNALSAMLDLHQREGRQDRLGARVSITASEAVVTTEGPLGKKSNFMLSYRKSYTEYLLRSLNVPVLPNYSDVQFRNKIRINDKNEVTFIALAGFDDYNLNRTAEASDVLLYNLGYIPEGEQQVYTVGANYKHYLDNAYYNVILSRNSFANTAEKFRDNTGSETDRLLDYNSVEADNRLRIEYNYFKRGHKLSYGGNFRLTTFDINQYAIAFKRGILDTSNFEGGLNFLAYGAFFNYSLTALEDRLHFFAGVRTDDNSNVSEGGLIDHLSPRVSLNYHFTSKLNMSVQAGRYFQMPQAILLTYNWRNPPERSRGYTEYIQSDQISAGIEYKNNQSYRISLEGFYKLYSNYPFLLDDQISFANAQAEYVVIGNQTSDNSSEGRAFGTELFIQQKLKKNYWWMLSYTYSVSEFKDKDGTFRPSNWDSRHYMNILFGKTWGKGWQIGVKWSYASGTPYTPYDVFNSSQKDNWNVVNRGIFDYDRLNESRLPDFHKLDFRLDKNFYFDKWNLNVFLDLQNLYRSSLATIPYLTVQRNTQFEPLTDPRDHSRYLVEEIDSDTGRLLYGLGLIAEF